MNYYGHIILMDIEAFVLNMILNSYKGLYQMDICTAFLMFNTRMIPQNFQ